MSVNGPSSHELWKKRGAKWGIEAPRILTGRKPGSLWDSLATEPLPLPHRTSWYKSRGAQGWGSCSPHALELGHESQHWGKCQLPAEGYRAHQYQVLWERGSPSPQSLGNASVLEQCLLQTNSSFLQWELVHMWPSVVEKSWVTLNAKLTLCYVA